MSDKSKLTAAATPDPSESQDSRLRSFALVRRAQDGSQGVWNDINERYWRRLHVLAEHLMSPQLLAQYPPAAVVNEVLFNTYRKIDSFEYRESGALHRWMCTQIRRHLADLGRHEKARRPRSGGRVDLDELGSIDEPAQRDGLAGLESRDELHRLAEALGDPTMPAIHREVLVAIVLECKSSADVAEELGVSRDVVRQRLSRGRRIWKRILAESGTATSSC